MKYFFICISVFFGCSIQAHKRDLIALEKKANMPLAYSPVAILSQVFDCLYEFDAYCPSQKTVPNDVPFYDRMQLLCGESFASYSMVSFFLDHVIKYHEERLKMQDKQWQAPSNFCCSAGRILPASARVAVIGDLHGSVHSLARSLVRLQQQEHFDHSFRLAHDAWLVILGDVGDRGFYSLETWLLLLSVWMVNPDRMIIMQGNHETKEIFDMYGFRYELLSKLGMSLDVYSLINRFLYFFSLLPQALFLGTHKSPLHAMHFLQLCHGGISDYVKKNVVINSSYVHKNHVTTIEFKKFLYFLCRMHEDQRLFFYSYNNNGIAQDNGLIWNGFYALPNDKAPMMKLGKRRDNDLVHHGRAVMEYFHDLQAPHFSLDGIIRGHEHLNAGINKLSYDHVSGSDVIPLTEKEYIHATSEHDAYPVYTLTSAPQLRPYDSYAMLSFDMSMQSWEIVPFVSPVIFSYATDKGHKHPEYIYRRRMKMGYGNGDFEYYGESKIHQSDLP